MGTGRVHCDALERAMGPEFDAGRNRPAERYDFPAAKATFLAKPLQLPLLLRPPSPPPQDVMGPLVEVRQPPRGRAVEAAPERG
jgi:hypothetical protein